MPSGRVKPAGRGREGLGDPGGTARLGIRLREVSQGACLFVGCPEFVILRNSFILLVQKQQRHFTGKINPPSFLPTDTSLDPQNCIKRALGPQDERGWKSLTWVSLQAHHPAAAMGSMEGSAPSSQEEEDRRGS